MESTYKVVRVSADWPALTIEIMLNGETEKGYEVVQATAVKEAVIYLLKKVK